MFTPSFKVNGQVLAVTCNKQKQTASAKSNIRRTAAKGCWAKTIRLLSSFVFGIQRERLTQWTTFNRCFPSRTLTRSRHSSSCTESFILTRLVKQKLPSSSSSRTWKEDTTESLSLSRCPEGQPRRLRVTNH